MVAKRLAGAIPVLDAVTVAFFCGTGAASEGCCCFGWFSIKGAVRVCFEGVGVLTTGEGEGEGEDRRSFPLCSGDGMPPLSDFETGDVLAMAVVAEAVGSPGGLGAEAGGVGTSSGSFPAEAVLDEAYAAEVSGSLKSWAMFTARCLGVWVSGGSVREA